jgi:uncharacterized OsmC-like protein
MQSEDLRALQAPLKEQYRREPESAKITMHSRGRLEPHALLCHVAARGGDIDSGLHRAAGGDGSRACSGDMLLDALVACAGVTLCAVATAMSIPLRGGDVTAQGTVDFRGTLGVDRQAPIGMTDVRLTFTLDTDAPAEQVEKLIQLTERYCVILQTLKSPPTISAGWQKVKSEE